MKSLIDPYQRMLKYYIYFSNKDFTLDENFEYGCSMASLNDHLSIPLTVIRRDIATLFSMPECGYLFFDQETDTEEEESCKPEIICKKIISGDCDNIPIVSALPFQYTDSEIPVTMKPSEAALLTNYAQGQIHTQNYSGADYRIKKSYRFRETPALTDKLRTINQAINKSSAVMIRYQDPQKRTLNLEVYPISLLYDSTDNIYAVVAAYDRFSHLYTYRLDRMVYVSVVKNKVWDPAGQEYKKLLKKLNAAPHVWDRNFDILDLEHVKVCFLNTVNVWEKVKKDLAYRSRGKLYEGTELILGKKTNVLIYEDEVSGMNSFRHWLAGYGSAAYVLEPISLRKQICRSLKKQLMNYSG